MLGHKNERLHGMIEDPDRSARGYRMGTRQSNPVNAASVNEILFLTFSRTTSNADILSVATKSSVSESSSKSSLTLPLATFRRAKDVKSIDVSAWLSVIVTGFFVSSNVLL